MSERSVIWKKLAQYNFIGHGEVTLMSRDDEIYLIEIKNKTRKVFESFSSRRDADWYIQTLKNMSVKLTDDGDGSETWIKLQMHGNLKLHPVEQLPIPVELPAPKKLPGVLAMFRCNDEPSNEPSNESKLLWHGTLLKNLASILKKGFKLPSSCGGLMFGAGIYFANIIEKSLNYTDKTGLKVLLLCEVNLGVSLTMTESKEFVRCPEGYDSVFAPAGAGETALVNDEYVIYDPSRATPKYIIVLRENIGSP